LRSVECARYPVLFVTDSISTFETSSERDIKPRTNLDPVRQKAPVMKTPANAKIVSNTTSQDIGGTGPS
jgi:hypothetical protein